MSQVAEILNKIETKTCSRCGGSGNYSYCQQYGTTCFGCGGSGRQFTKRGAATRNFLEAIRSKPAADVQPGDVVRCGCITMGGKPYDKFLTVLAVGREIVRGESLRNVDGVYKMVPYEMEQVVIDCGEHHAHLGLDSAVRIQHAKGDPKTAETWSRAMEFQASLTAYGKPRKR